MKQILHPRLGCAAVVVDGDRILLGIRGKEPNKGKWILPGGGVKFLEEIRITLKRELLEETNLHVDVESFIGVYEIINPPDEHRVILYWRARYKNGIIRPSSDLLDARFFSKDEIKTLISCDQTTEISNQVLKDIGWG